MMREMLIKRIIELLSWIESKVKNLNSIHYQDINITSETFFANFFNLVFEYELINRNSQKINSPYADLYDSKNDIYIQVTSERTSLKIQETIDGIETLPGVLGTTKVFVMLLTEKPSYRAFFKTNIITFNKDTDIYDTKQLIRYIATLSNEKLRKIVDYLEGNLNAINGAEKTICSEEETLISIIEFLSKSENITSDIPSIIDPEDKINRRFSTFASRIKSQYADHYIVYGTQGKMVNDMLIKDEATKTKIGNYLKHISINQLDLNNNNPLAALDALVNLLDTLISSNHKRYDKGAIRFFLVSQIIDCNVFPNEIKKETA